MADITRKSIGSLIDELVTTNVKCYMELEKAADAAAAADKIAVGEHYGKAQKLNSRRSALIQAIDRALGDGDITLTDKSYG